MQIEDNIRSVLTEESLKNYEEINNYLDSLSEEIS
jgi:hypothetical protein